MLYLQPPPCAKLQRRAAAGIDGTRTALRAQCKKGGGYPEETAFIQLPQRGLLANASLWRTGLSSPSPPRIGPFFVDRSTLLRRSVVEAGIGNICPRNSLYLFEGSIRSVRSLRLATVRHLRFAVHKSRNDVGSNLIVQVF